MRLSQRFVHPAGLFPVLAIVLSTAGPSLAQNVAVPGDYATVQEAIDAAPEGAVITVAPGRYVENIDFGGKAVTLQGSGPESILDGNFSGPVVRFVNGEGEASVLDSFTITNGFSPLGGGIEIRDSSPTILRNVIAGNSSTGVGSGIYVGGLAAEPRILNNLMVFNTGVNGSDPHTIQVANSSPRIFNNTIARNDSNAILTSGSGTPEIANNILARNGSRTVATGTKGRGICDFAPGTTTMHNLFYRNVISAILTAGQDFRRIRRAQDELGRARLANNIDAAPRFTEGGIPRRLEDAGPERFLPTTDPDRPSRAVGAGDPSPEFNNPDGTRNTIGFTGGPWAEKSGTDLIFP
jgi:hypothetical protein